MQIPRDFQKLLKEFQKMQKKMQEAMAELEEKAVTAQVGGGMVKVSANGRYEILSIEIEDELLKGGDKEMLQDLIVAGVNEALRLAKNMVEKEMETLSLSLGLPPGFKIPGF